MPRGDRAPHCYLVRMKAWRQQRTLTATRAATWIIRSPQLRYGDRLRSLELALGCRSSVKALVQLAGISRCECWVIPSVSPGVGDATGGELAVLAIC